MATKKTTKKAPTKKADGRSKTSAENGKKYGGRPKGAVSRNTLVAQEQRRILIETLAPHVKEVTTALIEKAKKGDVMAVKELFDRAWGKAPQPLAGHDGGPLFTFDDETKSKVRQAWEEVLD